MPTERERPRPPTAARALLPILGTLAAIAVVEVAAHGRLGYPFPETLLVGTIIVIAVAGYTGGPLAGLLSAALVSLYAFRFNAEDGNLLSFSPETWFSFTLLAGLAFLSGGTTGLLQRRRETRATRALLKERERADELMRMNRALAVANEGLESFASMVSHDLKEPLRGIMAYLEEAAEAIDTDQAKASIQNARASTQKLATLLEGLLEVSRAARPDAGECLPLPVLEVARSGPCLARYADLLDERSAKLELVETHDTPPAMATEAALAQILGNLIVNAIEHNNGREPRVRLTATRHHRDPDSVEIVIEDNGPGFPENIRTLVEYPEPRSTQVVHGGFGLIAVRRALARLGGRFWIDRSADLGGTAIHITLPAAHGTFIPNPGIERPSP